MIDDGCPFFSGFLIFFLLHKMILVGFKNQILTCKYLQIIKKFKDEEQNKNRL